MPQSLLLPLTAIILSLCVAGIGGQTPPGLPDRPPEQRIPRQLLTTFPDPGEGSPLSDLIRGWNSRPPTQDREFRQRQRQLLGIVADSALTAEQRKHADDLSIQMEHDRRMAGAFSRPQTARQLAEACHWARRLQDFRSAFPDCRRTPPQQLFELALRDPFNMELEKALRDTNIIRLVSEPWEVSASEDFTDFAPLTHHSWTEHTKMIHLKATIKQPSKSAEELALAFKGLPHTATVSVDGIPQSRFPADARCSFRVRLPRRFPDQQRFTIDIHIPHPPQDFMPARTWIIGTKRTPIVSKP